MLRRMHLWCGGGGEEVLREPSTDRRAHGGFRAAMYSPSQRLQVNHLFRGAFHCFPCCLYHQAVYRMRAVLQVCKLVLSTLQGLLRQYPGPVGHHAKTLIPVLVGFEKIFAGGIDQECHGVHKFWVQMRRDITFREESKGYHMPDMLLQMQKWYSSP